MLEELARRRLYVATLGGGIFDNPSGTARIPRFEEQIAENADKTVLVTEDFTAQTTPSATTSIRASTVPSGTR